MFTLPRRAGKLISGFFLLFFSLVALSSYIPPSTATLEKDVLNYTNRFRASKRLPALEIREDLCAIARKHSQDMARHRKALGHSGFNTRMAQARRIMNRPIKMGENVAQSSESARQVVNMWKGSSVHRRNMLGNFRYIGIGTARSRNGAVYYTQIFVR